MVYIYTCKNKIMITKSVKKFETFEELKSHEKTPTNYSVSLKKHNAFEEFIKSVKPQWKINSKFK